MVNALTYFYKILTTVGVIIVTYVKDRRYKNSNFTINNTKNDITMKAINLLAVLGFALLTSCATFKNGQTPDDVYYSPLKKYSEQTKVNSTTDNNTTNQEENSYNYEDRSLRTSTRTNDRRWRTLDEDYDDYRYNHNCNCNCNNTIGYGFGNTIWGYNNNPHFNTWGNNVVLIQPTVRAPKYTAPRGGNATVTRRVYSNNRYDNNNTNQVDFKVKPNSGSNNGGGLLNRIFNGSSNSSGNSPVRSYEPSSSGSSNSGGGRSSSSGSSSPSSSRPGRSGQ